jgi:hypothetical protein
MRRITRRINNAWRHKNVRLEDLERAGRGMLVEVEDDDGSQILVWLR